MTDSGWDLEAIGFDAYFQTRLTALEATEGGGRALVPARIAIAHGESYIAWAQRGSCKALLVGRRIAKWRDAADRPQVGDWIAGSYSESGDSLLIEHVLERRTCLMRLAAGESGAGQVIAANVDVVGIVSAFDENKGDEGKMDEGKTGARGRRLINEPRLRRYLTAVEQSRAQPVLIVNKSDLGADPVAIATTLGTIFPGVPVVLTSATEGAGLDGLSPWLTRGRTLGLVGMSGVGKSTLANALLGRAAQRIGDVRDSDARGRHTTTHRELFVMENGALLLDTPGMRELGLWDEDESVLATSFDDVVAQATRCRFTNCRHATEPDCAIRAALADGTLSADRWASYQKHLQKYSHPDPRARTPPSGGGSGGRPHGPSKRRGR